MDKLDSIRRRQQQENSSGNTAYSATGRRTTASARPSSSGSVNRSKKSKKKKRKSYAILVRVLIIGVLLAILAVSALIVWATWGMDFNFEDQFSRTGMNLTSVVYYEDEDGNLQYYERLIADQNRIWVDIENVPRNLKDAFVAIEDQRFYGHHGIDIKRTSGAVLNVIFKGDSSYGGSTITQQLVKNVTADSENTTARKIREMVRAVIVEARMEKDEILELYLNSIYLGHGANGVQAAAKVYFNKDVKDLTLVECASIAGITKYPSMYDPIIEPEANKERRQLVLDKMLELEYITQEEYDEASSAQLSVLTPEEDERNTTQSYFVDYLYEELLADLMSLGYSQTYATDLIYNGGLKIVSTVDPEIQAIMNDAYENGTGFPTFYGEAPQSAMVITDPHTGYIKGIVGGTGKKTGARVLNRASQTRRQPGSTMKPIAVYGPAINEGVITLASRVQNTPLKIGNWEPLNANKSFFSESESIRSAVASSLNLPAARILEELTIDTSYRYVTESMHLNLTKSDKDYSPLSLGGVSEGVTVIELNSAYASFANGGDYIQPVSYSKVYDANGKLLIDNTPEQNQVFSEETAFIMTELLSTAAGHSISGIQTCGKTGSSDNYMDRWFAGFTPYYSGVVWVGYDEQKVISSSSSNPATTIWHSIMERVHENYASKSFEQPVGVERVFTCSYTGQFGTSSCSGSNEYVNTRLMSGYCSGDHSNIIGTPGSMPEEEEETEGEETEGEQTEGEETEGEQTQTGETESEGTEGGEDITTVEPPASPTPEPEVTVEPQGTQGT